MCLERVVGILHCVLQFIFSIVRNKQMSTEALIELVNKFLIIQDMRRADYKENKKKNI